ncbi:hypothetical protein HY041_01395 [Candidatus Roizmanbacteria bacterium]|nr:hypothetical protein [Candidatus Roizmanbacteria bacterium]
MQNIEKDYKTVIEEISKYNTAILSKKTIILLTKIDLISTNLIKEKIKALKKFGAPIIPVSIYNEESIKMLQQVLSA